MKTTFYLLGFVAICAMACHNNTPAEYVGPVADTLVGPVVSQVSQFYSHGDKGKFVADFDTALMEKFGGKQLQAMAWAGPNKLVLEGGQYFLVGLTDAVNFDIDPDCSNKLFRFKVPMDTAIAYLVPHGYSAGFYFSWQNVFDTTAKRFVVEEIWHRGEYNKVLAELRDYNLYWNSKGIDSLEIQEFWARDVFDKEFYIEYRVVNNSNSPIEKASVDMVLTEYENGNTGSKVIDSIRYAGMDLLVAPVPPHTFQIVRKTFKNKGYKPSGEIRLRYYDTKQTLKGYQSNGQSFEVSREI